MSGEEDEGSHPKRSLVGGMPWCETSTAGRTFYRLPNKEKPDGELYGLDGASSVDGDQSGMRIIGFGTWVSAPFIRA
jgi:hypothetical protein